MEKIILDRAKCTGLGICESIAPDYFEVDDDGDLIMLKEVIDDADSADIDHAIKTCPTRALSRQ